MVKKKKLYILSLMFSVAATAIGSGVIGIILNEIVSEYSLADYQEGFMSSCISAGALSALFAGIALRSKIHKYQFISFGGLLMAVMLLLKGIPVPFSLFLLICFAMGLGMGVMDSFQTSYLADLLPDNTAKGLGLLHGIFGIGGFTLPLVLHGLLKTMSWHSVCLLLGAFRPIPAVLPDRDYSKRRNFVRDCMGNRDFVRGTGGVMAACIASGLASGCCMPMLLNEGAAFNRDNTGFITSVLMIVKTTGQILCPVLISHLKAAGGVQISMLMIALLFFINGAAAWIMTRMKLRMSVDS